MKFVVTTRNRNTGEVDSITFYCKKAAKAYALKCDEYGYDYGIIYKGTSIWQKALLFMFALIAN